MNKLDKIVFRFTFELFFKMSQVILVFGFRIYLGLFKIFIGSIADRITLILLIVIYYLRKGSGYDNLILKCIINLGLVAYIYGKSYCKTINERIEYMPVIVRDTGKGNNKGNGGSSGGSNINLDPLKQTAKVAKDESKKYFFELRQAIKDTIAREKRKSKEKAKEESKVIEIKNYKKREELLNGWSYYKRFYSINIILSSI